MKKITETELKNRVNSLREYFTSLDERHVPATKPIFTKDDGTNAEPAGFVKPPPGVILDTDPVNGKTPEEAMKDPRYTTDPAFKAEVDAAAAIGTAPAAVATPVPAPAPAVVTTLPPMGQTVVTPVAAPTNVPRDANGVNIANKPVGDSAAKVSTPAPPYIVQKGDNLTKIAKQMGVTLQDLLKVNPQFQQKGRNINLIYPNEPVNRPPVAPVAAPASKQIGNATAPVKPVAAPAPILPSSDAVNPSGKVQDAPAATQPANRLNPKDGTIITAPLTKQQQDTINANDRAINPRKSYQYESVTYADDQTLARIISLSRR